MSYPTFTLEKLQQRVAQRSHAQVVRSGTGAFLAVEQGARLLGLFPEPGLPNVLWVNAEIEALLARRDWFVGGERLWLAPERHFFYENPRDFEGFHVPSDIDPGNYQLDQDTTYRNEFSLLDLSKSMVYDRSIATRRFSPIDDPYGTSLAYSGVRIEETVSVPTTEAVFCAWSLAMVYTCGPAAPGTTLVPTADNADFISYFEPIPPNRAELMNGYARFRVDGNAVYKFAIAPEHIRFENPCKVAYVSPYPDGEHWFCLMKLSNDLPRSQQECVDPARGNPDGPKGAIQAYNNGPSDAPIEFVSFGEIELQLNSGQVRGERTVSSAAHELLAYAGTREEILDITRKALAIEQPPAVY